jgi:CDP-6-deoxy-D-xylo-4-hexulose-3-dehydrase
MGKRAKLLEFLSSHNIDTRPIVAGNFTRNPVMKYLEFNSLPNLVNSDLIHNNGFFIGNHHFDVTIQLREIYSLLLEFERSNT